MKKLLALLAVGAIAASTHGQTVCTEDFSTDLPSACGWLTVGDFGGQASSISVAGGVATITKTGAAGDFTQAIGLSAGGTDNRIAPPWSAEVTVVDLTDLPADGGYLAVRFWIPGQPAYDWVRLDNTGGVINLRDSAGTSIESFALGSTSSLRLKFDVDVSGLTVSAAPNAGTYGAETALAWAATVEESTVVGMYMAGIDIVGGVTPGPFSIDLDDLTLTTPEAGDGDGDGDGGPIIPPGAPVGGLLGLGALAVAVAAGGALAIRRKK